MKIYVAAPWTYKFAAELTATRLEAAGHVVTKHWWKHREVPGYLTNDTDNAELKQQAIEDIDGVFDADVFLLLNFEKSEGKAVEMGIAIAAGIPVILVGNKSNIFHYLDDAIEECTDIDQVLRVLAAAA